MAPTMSSPKLGLLPKEVLVTILGYLKASTTFSDFVNFLLVCKKFHTVGQPVGLRLLCVNNKNFENWCQSINHYGGQFSNVEHLTVRICPDPPCACECETGLHGDVQPLLARDDACGRQCLRLCPADLHSSAKEFQSKFVSLERVIKTSLPKLLSFALVVDMEPADGTWCTCCVPTVPRQQLVKIIEALPSTCTHLHLDTGGCDSQYWPGDELGKYSRHECSLCHALRDRMRTLHHLWLRVAFLCPGFFVSDNTYGLDEFHLATGFERLRDDIHDAGIDYSLYHGDSGVDRPSLWVAWKTLPAAMRQVFLQGYENNIESVSKNSEHEPFPHLTSLTINTVTFPAQTGMDADGAAKVAKALSIATSRWQCFPKLETCYVIGRHLEGFSRQETFALKTSNMGSAKSLPSFRPFTDLFVFDVLSNTAFTIPFRFLVPERDLDMKNIAKQKLYAFHDMTLKKQWYGNFKAFDLLIDSQTSNGTVHGRAEGHCLPKSFLSEKLRLDGVDPGEGCISKVQMMIKVHQDRSRLLFPTKYLWFDRADAAIARKRDGILDSWEVRNGIDGNLRTIKKYALRPIA